MDGSTPDREHKRAKARAYALEPERFQLLEMHLKMKSQHGERDITFKQARWECSCEYFGENGICSHTMAAELIFHTLLNDVKNISS